MYYKLVVNLINGKKLVLKECVYHYFFSDKLVIQCFKGSDLFEYEFPKHCVTFLYRKMWF